MDFLFKHFFKLWAFWAVLSLGVGGYVIYLVIKILSKLADSL